MGNALTFLYGKCCKPTTTNESLGPHGVSAATVGVSALAHDLFNFEITSQVLHFLIEAAKYPLICFLCQPLYLFFQ